MEASSSFSSEERWRNLFDDDEPTPPMAPRKRSIAQMEQLIEEKQAKLAKLEAERDRLEAEAAEEYITVQVHLYSGKTLTYKRSRMTTLFSFMIDVASDLEVPFQGFFLKPMPMKTPRFPLRPDIPLLLGRDFTSKYQNTDDTIAFECYTRH